MAVALAELDGLRVLTWRSLPFTDLETLEWAVTPGNDPLVPGSTITVDHVDFVVEEAAKRNMYVGLLPTWGDKVGVPLGDGPMIFSNNPRLLTRLLNDWPSDTRTTGISSGYWVETDLPCMTGKEGNTMIDRCGELWQGPLRRRMITMFLSPTIRAGRRHRHFSPTRTGWICTRCKVATVTVPLKRGGYSKD